MTKQCRNGGHALDARTETAGGEVCFDCATAPVEESAPVTPELWHALEERLCKLQPNHVSEITYRCRDIGYGIEEGVIAGFWTGETDTWGKRTVRRIDGGPTLYLFDDEIVEVEPA